MTEIITFLIVSGGLGFFNLYVAQEADLLYFGKYNKEERLAWISIYSGLNFLSIKLVILILEYFKDVINSVILHVTSILIVLLLNIIVTLLLPVTINKIIDYVRSILKKSPRSHLPPTNSFFEEIDQWSLYAFDFNGKLINSGQIVHATEERQVDFSLIIRPTLPEDKPTYDFFLSKSLEGAKQEMLQIRELTDYTNKIHFVKIKLN